MQIKLSGLYMVSTPIGAAHDITLFALDVLSRADLLAAEDTRNTKKLLDIHGIKRDGPLISYHDHNGPEARPKILKALSEGKSVAYVSDAGTPLIADPGYALVRDAIDNGYEVHAAPGASAVLTALTISGLPSDRFFFLGFPPNKQMARKAWLSDVAEIQATLVLYESPKRIGASLKDMAEIFGENRMGVVCRELTKKFEEAKRGTLSELAAYFSEGARGEIVVLIAPPLKKEISQDVIDEALQEALSRLRVKDAAKEISDRFGVPRKEIYARALELTQ